MIKNNHHQSKEIESIVNELLTMRDQLKDTSAIRKLRLDDSLESQQFFIQCHELVCPLHSFANVQLSSLPWAIIDMDKSHGREGAQLTLYLLGYSANRFFCSFKQSNITYYKFGFIYTIT